MFAKGIDFFCWWVYNAIIMNQNEAEKVKGKLAIIYKTSKGTFYFLDRMKQFYSKEFKTLKAAINYAKELNIKSFDVLK